MTPKKKRTKVNNFFMEGWKHPYTFIALAIIAAITLITVVSIIYFGSKKIKIGSAEFEPKENLLRDLNK